MAETKSYTDILQSRELAKILPVESADMAWCNNSIKGINYTDKYLANLYTVEEMQEYFDDILDGWDKYWKLIPCWSLAALLEEIPYEICDDDGNSAYLSMYKENDNYQLVYESASDDFDDIETDVHEDFVDACYEMLLMLNDNNLL